MSQPTPRAASFHAPGPSAVACVLASLLAACPPSRPPEDAAGLDASLLDAPRGDTHTDVLACTVRCSTTQERCCFGDDGTPACIDVTSDVENCGLCGLDCVAALRGDHCESMQCACGDFPIGCTGEASSICCPVAADGRTERCANLGRDFADCGECGRACNPLQANRCEGGECRCGIDGAVCDGTATSLCCLDIFEVASCVDTTRDPLNCGDCNIRCGAFERCVDSDCVDFTIPDAGPPTDAGTGDAGTGDAGPGDAGTGDAGTVDAGARDAAIDAPSLEDAAS